MTTPNAGSPSILSFRQRSRPTRVDRLLRPPANFGEGPRAAGERLDASQVPPPIRSTTQPGASRHALRGGRSLLARELRRYDAAT
jgi:hypothetical protein